MWNEVSYPNIARLANVVAADSNLINLYEIGANPYRKSTKHLHLEQCWAKFRLLIFFFCFAIWRLLVIRGRVGLSWLDVITGASIRDTTHLNSRDSGRRIWDSIESSTVLPYIWNQQYPRDAHPRDACHMKSFEYTDNNDPLQQTRTDLITLLVANWSLGTKEIIAKGILSHGLRPISVRSRWDHVTVFQE